MDANVARMERESGGALSWALLAKAGRRKGAKISPLSRTIRRPPCDSALIGLWVPPRTPDPTALGDLRVFARETRSTHFVPPCSVWLTHLSLANTFAANPKGELMVVAGRVKGQYVDAQRVKRRDAPNRALSTGDSARQTPLSLAAFAANGRPAFPRHRRTAAGGSSPSFQSVVRKISSHSSGDRPTASPRLPTNTELPNSELD